MPQNPSTPTTRYAVSKRPSIKDGYPQRIELWKAVEKLGSVNRAELFRALQKANYIRPRNAPVDEVYCRIELTDMTRRGFLKRLD